MRLLIDQNLPYALSSALREAGHDVVHVQDEKLERAVDEDILEFCCIEGRMLITADKKLTKFLASLRAKCPSVLITRDLRTSHTTDLARLIAANLPAMGELIAEHGNAIFTLAPSKPIRASLLPVGHPRTE